MSEARGDAMQDEINKQIKILNNEINKWMYEIQMKQNEYDEIDNNMFFLQDLNALTIEEQAKLIKKNIKKVILWKGNIRSHYECDVVYSTGVINSFKIHSGSKFPKFYNEYGEELNIEIIRRFGKRNR